MGLSTKNPYGAGMSAKLPPETISGELSKAGSKAKAAYPSGTPSIEPGGGAGGNAGKMKTRAYTPGGPSGS